LVGGTYSTRIRFVCTSAARIDTCALATSTPQTTSSDHANDLVGIDRSRRFLGKMRTLWPRRRRIGSRHLLPRYIGITIHWNHDPSPLEWVLACNRLREGCAVSLRRPLASINSLLSGGRRFVIHNV